MARSRYEGVDVIGSLLFALARKGWRRRRRRRGAPPPRRQVSRWGATRTTAPRRRPKRWMQRAFAKHKRGSLHRYLGVPLGQKIPAALLVTTERRLARDHARASGARRRKLLSRLREVRLAITARRVLAGHF